MWSWPLRRNGKAEETDSPSAAAPVEGVDYEVFRDRSMLDASQGTHIRAVSFHTATGFLTPETHERLKAATDRYCTGNQIDALARIVHHATPLAEADMENVAQDVNIILRKLGSLQGDITKQGGELGPIFMQQLASAMRTHHATSRAAFVASYETLPVEVKEKFSKTNQAALADPDQRAGVIGHLQRFEELSALTRALRSEAVAALGEDHMRPRHVEGGAQGNRTTTRMQLHERANRGWTTGGGITRENGSTHYGNGR